MGGSHPAEMWEPTTWLVSNGPAAAFEQTHEAFHMPIQEGSGRYHGAERSWCMAASENTSFSHAFHEQAQPGQTAPSTWSVAQSSGASLPHMNGQLHRQAPAAAIDIRRNTQPLLRRGFLKNHQSALAGETQPSSWQSNGQDSLVRSNPCASQFPADAMPPPPGQPPMLQFSMRQPARSALPPPPPPPAEEQQAFLQRSSSAAEGEESSSTAVLRLSDAISSDGAAVRGLGPVLGSAECPTIGSSNHHLGGCRPCAFFHTRGCGNGDGCPFCHLCAFGEKKKRLKEKRVARREAKYNASAAAL